MASLDHRNIVPYYGTNRDSHYLTIFMEYVPGGSISSIIKKFGPLNETVLRVYLKQILAGLDYLHSHG